jgi:phage terminase large subunit-like protein
VSRQLRKPSQIIRSFTTATLYLRWMIDSTVVDMDGAGNRKPNKRKSQGDDGTKGKIDGVVAMCMAMGEASQQEADVLPAIY